MASESTSGREASEAALLKEYEVCQQEATSAATRNWAAIALILAGEFLVLVRLLEPEVTRSILLLAVLGLVGPLASVFFIWSFQRRATFDRSIMFARQRQIERRLCMFKSRLFNYLDSVGKSQHLATAQLPDELGGAVSQEDWEALRKLKGKGSGGRYLVFMAWLFAGLLLATALIVRLD